jgi:FKBP-type peptidyl-prolyl cis-trans isomerase
MNSKIAISIIVILLIILGVFLFMKNKKVNNSTVSPIDQPSQTTSNDSTSQLKIVDTKVGDGTEAKAGDTLSVKYTGKLTDGTIFDSTDKHGGQPFSFTLGAGQVIEGWDQGLVGMKVGGERELTIPSDLAYGDQATGSIPANSTLIFTVQLVSIN